MTIIAPTTADPLVADVLESGDRMTQAEFHRLYEKMPESFKAELIGETVYVASPLRRPHGTRHLRVGNALDAYVGYTPGTEAADNTTLILGEEDESQPDLFLRILPEYGGQSRDNDDEYIEGAPELVAEIAHSSRAIDLHAKRERYTAAGVLEYIVICLRPRQLRWFDLRTGREFAVDVDGLFRSVVFPGLWLHAESLWHMDYPRLMAVLQRGLDSAEHGLFVDRLAAKAAGR